MNKTLGLISAGLLGASLPFALPAIGSALGVGAGAVAGTASGVGAGQSIAALGASGAGGAGLGTGTSATLGSAGTSASSGLGLSSLFKVLQAFSPFIQPSGSNGMNLPIGNQSSTQQTPTWKPTIDIDSELNNWRANR